MEDQNKKPVPATGTDEKDLKKEIIERATEKEANSEEPVVAENINPQDLPANKTESGVVDPLTEAQDENGENKTESDGMDDLYTPTFKPGEVVQRSIIEEMKSNYLDYSMSVIVSRALPETRDGLKPSQRRILVAMNDLNLTNTAHYRKSSKIIGDTIGSYHPHGDIVVYPTMVKMAQNFAIRYPLIDPQGNFGSIDGDSPAAMRYTEARMSKITMELLRDLDKGTVTFVPNYDATRPEPTILPSLFPNLLCNGSEGIAVGMATKIPPHNLSEVVDALRTMIAKGNKWEGEAIFNELRNEKEKSERTPRVLNAMPADVYENYYPIEDKDRFSKISLVSDKPLYPRFESDITTEELIKIIPGPDFPTGATIYDRSEIINAYATGRGRILMRAKASIEEGKNGRMQIILTELPFQVNKALLIEHIADLVKEKKIEGIADIRDESTNDIRVLIILKKEANPKVILNKLYKYTDMQKAFSTNMISLVDGEPQTLNLKKMLELFLSHRITITIRRYEFDLAQTRFRSHILEGLLKALDILDEIIATIRASKTQEEAKNNLIDKFDFTEAQALAILDMQLRKLAALERQKLQDEFDEKKAFIAECIRVLSDESELLKIVDQDLAYLKEKYGDARRTKVVAGKVDDISEEDTVAEAQTFVTISHSGYIKRVPPETYRVQNRGGKGIIGATTKEDDYIQNALTCSTHSELMLFTNKGRVFILKAYQIPETSRTAKGIPVVNLIQVEQGEIVTSVLSKDKKMFDADGKEVPMPEYKFMFMATKRGTVKKTVLEDFDNIRSSGLIAIKLEAGDELKWVQMTEGNNDIMLVNKNGKCIRFSEEDVRPTGRNTMGVTGIKFKSEGDEVISMDVIRGSKVASKQEEKAIKVLTISENAFGKMTPLKEYEAQNRAGSGVFTFRVTPKTGKLILARLMKPEDEEVVLISTKGQVIRVKVADVKVLNNRQTSGVKIMNMHDGDSVAAMALV